MKRVYILILVLFFAGRVNSQHTVARKWNDALLEAIRNDYARPTVHARNLFHFSVSMYDSWVVYNSGADTYFLGKELYGFKCDYNGISSSSPENDVKVTMSYAAYRLLSHRFQNSPNYFITQNSFDALMNELGYDITFVSSDYSNGSAAALGNYIAEKMIEYGLQDGSNEVNEYANLFYEPVNLPLAPELPGNPDIFNVNRWQPLTLEVFIDQAGNIIPGATPEFLSPEWGNVLPFSLTDVDRTIHERNGNEYWVFNDPGSPPKMNLDIVDLESSEYRWNFELVSIWSSHLDALDGVMWDISPGAIGNLNELPSTWDGYHNFYDLLNGGDPSTGHSINPTTGKAYGQQIVPRGDYGRVLAEFWADGPDSETPPGHWFTLLNYVNDHPMLIKKFKGEGEIVNDLEWDVKSYFLLGGAMHDAAISAWGIKGWYDYIRPISAIRAMADRGQSTDSSLPNYSESGISLKDGFIELVQGGDALAGINNENVGKVKLMAWKGPDYISNPATDVAGVGWILAENWWPYQRPSFVTPPFAGYVSGHSTYSRAAAEVLTLLTGDPFFPGGMGEFLAPKNEFLVFEEGPSVDVTLQWATYRDASDQCSLSRIWGGIHPPADDMPGRIIGEKIGVQSFELAEKYFNNKITKIDPLESKLSLVLNGNPVKNFISFRLHQNDTKSKTEVRLLDLWGDTVFENEYAPDNKNFSISTEHFPKGMYLLIVRINNEAWSEKVIVN